MEIPDTVFVYISLSVYLYHGALNVFVINSPLVLVNDRNKMYTFIIIISENEKYKARHKFLAFHIKLSLVGLKFPLF